MPDTRFFPPGDPLSLRELARVSGAAAGASDDPERRFANVAPLDAATGEDVSFLDNKRYADQFRATRAGCCIVESRYAAQAPAETAVLVTDRPYLAYARVAAAFHPDWDRMYVPTGPGEAVHPDAAVGAGTVIGVGAVIGPGAEIGENCVIGPNAYIGEGVRIGDGCRIGPLVSVRCSLVGNRVVLCAGARIGEPGFGIAFAPEETVTIPQLGRVVIEDGVEIGANSAVDRGAGPDTVIGRGSRIDNLVQIGHNVRLGRHCAIAGMAGVAGSSRLGDRVMVGGMTAISGHLSVGDGARVAGHSGVVRDVPPGGTVMGTPAVPIMQFFRQAVTLSRLAGKEGTRE